MCSVTCLGVRAVGAGHETPWEWLGTLSLPARFLHPNHRCRHTKRVPRRKTSHPGGLVFPRRTFSAEVGTFSVKEGEQR